MNLKPMRVSIWNPPGTPANVWGAWLKLDDDNPEFGQTEQHENVVLFWLNENVEYGWGATLRVKLNNGIEYSERLILAEHTDFNVPGIVAPALLPVRVEYGRFRTDAGWMVPRFYTMLHAVYLVKSGNLDELYRLLDRAVAAGCNGIRFSGMLDWESQGIEFSLLDPDYPQWLDTVVQEAAKRGLYSEIAFFCDAQRIVPSHTDRIAWVDWFADFCNSRPSVFAQIANEPHKNGWEEANDPKLIELGRRFKGRSNTIMSLGDPKDLRGFSVLQKQIAEVADYLVLHSDRKVTNERFRWVNHLDSFWDSKKNYPSKALLHDEPMGMAEVFDAGRRDNSAVAHVAGAFVGAMIGGYTCMHRSTENDGVPGFLEAVRAAEVPGDPSWRFVNATLTGSPVEDFDGWDKIRTATNGIEGLVVAYGGKVGAMKLRSGWGLGEQIVDLKDAIGAVSVWKVSRR